MTWYTAVKPTPNAPVVEMSSYLPRLLTRRNRWRSQREIGAAFLQILSAATGEDCGVPNRQAVLVRTETDGVRTRVVSVLISSCRRTSAAREVS